MSQLQEGVSPVQPEDYARVVEVWEASVRATHHFVAEEDILVFRPLVRNALPHITLACVRDNEGVVVGFIAVADGKVEMLFISPDWRGHGVGRRLLQHAIDTLNATELDVNEQNDQALGFYLKMGFSVVGRSEFDGTNKPYPLLNMRLKS
jgi:putative acetyltransferase